MSNYKSVRLEEHVYRELMRLMKPRESVSQVIERLINDMEEITKYARAISKIKGDD